MLNSPKLNHVILLMFVLLSFWACLDDSPKTVQGGDREASEAPDSSETFVGSDGDATDVEPESEWPWYGDPEATCPDLAGCFSVHSTNYIDGPTYWDTPNITAVQEGCSLTVHCPNGVTNPREYEVSYTYEVSPDGKTLIWKWGGDLIPWRGDGLDASGHGCWHAAAPFTDFYVTVCRTGDACPGECLPVYSDGDVD